MFAHSKRVRGIGVYVAAFSFVVCSTISLYSDDVETAPAYKPPALQPSLIDFLTGLPISNKMKELATPELLREPFAGAPVDSVKGLASKIKAKEEDADNRIKAVKYLGTVDCFANPTSQAVLIDTMNSDPVEKVRLAAVKAIQNQFKRGQNEKPRRREARRYDSCRGCCGKDALNALSAVAYDYDDTGCPLEPSERVRKAARKALGECMECCQHSCQADSVPPEPAAPYEEAPGQKPKEEGAAPKSEQPAAPKIIPVPPAEDPAKPAKPSAKAADANASNQSQLTPVQKALKNLYARHGMKLPTGFLPGKPAAVTEPPTNVSDVQLAKRTEPAKPEPTEASIVQVKQSTVEFVDTAGLTELYCLRGYCVVSLVQNRLIKAKPAFASVHDGHVYKFATEDAKQKFDSQPTRYVPAMSGIDAVHFKKTGEKLMGSYLCKCDGRLYFFLSKATRNEFTDNPDEFAVE